MLDLDLPWFLSAIILIFVMSYALGIVAHELGHAGMAWLLGFHPRLIRIGAGPSLLRFKLGSAWFDMRLWPVYGFVSCLPRPAGRNRAYVAYLLAGVGVNSIAAALMAVLWGTSNGADDQIFWAISIGYAQLALVATAATPFVFKWHGRKNGSDMYKVLRLFGHPEMGTIGERYAAAMHRIAPSGTPIPQPSPQAPEIIYQVTRSDRMMDRWAGEETARALRALLALDDLPALERALMLDSLVLLKRHEADAAAREEIDAWSSEAVALANGPYTLVMRGGALIVLGRPQEALVLLKPLEDAAATVGRGPLCRAYIRWAEAEQRLQNSNDDLNVTRARAPRASCLPPGDST